jgi:predicted metalloprotease
MQWQGARRSTNIEDRRGMRVRTGLVGGGLGTILLLLLAMYFGVDPRYVLNRGGVEAYETGPASTSPADERTKDFVSAVLGYTEDTWSEIFRNAGRTYQEPTLVLFTGEVDSACGFAQAATGPFYCPGDAKVYLDMSFFQELSDRFKAPGDFAQAYVIAHEIGHHVQNLFGISRRFQAYRSRSSPAEVNRASVRLELQADCFAGVWANRTERAEESRMKQFLERGDVDEALRAASMIGDDRLQMQAQGYVVPESFTHGTAYQRSHWFKTGLRSGNVSDCDTFNNAEP